MAEVADRLDDLVLGRGGTSRDLQVLLAAELGALLQRRRARLAELLEGRTPPRVEPLSDESATLVALELGLDTPHPAEGGAAPPDFSDATEEMGPGAFDFGRE